MDYKYIIVDSLLNMKSGTFVGKRKKLIEEEGHANRMFLDKEFVLGKDNVFNPEERLKEAEARTLPLKHLLKQGCDLIWILDGDEFYTRDEITKTLNFVKQNNLVDWYKINFKNYIVIKILYL